jgi:hypothetical protein
LCHQEVDEDGDVPLLTQLARKRLEAQVGVLVQRERVDQAAHIFVDQRALAVPDAAWSAF